MAHTHRRTASARARIFAALLSLALPLAAAAQDKQQPGGAAAQAGQQEGAHAEHGEHILGVRVGMSVPEALKAVFENTATDPAPPRPDALKDEGKDKKDVRVVYKNLKEGELHIVFAGGRGGFVREVTLAYAKQPTMSDLKLPPTGSINATTIRADVYDSILNQGQQYDTRYSVGFTDDRKTERFWWREARTPAGYDVRVGFVSGKLTGSGSGAMSAKLITRKVLMVKPGDESKFTKAVAGS